MTSRTESVLPEAWSPTKPTLFSLSEDLTVLDAMLTESGGELTPEIETALQAVGAQLEAKTDGVAWFIRTCEARSAALKTVEDELAAKRSTEDRKIERLKDYVRACMDLRGSRKLAGQVYTFAIQQNGGKPPLRLLTDDPAAFPPECIKIVRSVDREQVRLLIESGNDLATLAVIDPPGSHLRLR